MNHERRIADGQSLRQVRVTGQEVVGIADGADGGDARELQIADGLPEPADVADITLRHVVPAHELAVAEHHARITCLRRTLKKGDPLVDVLIDQQIRGQVDPAMFQRYSSGRPYAEQSLGQRWRKLLFLST